MIKEAIGFGQSIDEAKEDAIKKLGASELDDVQFEVIAIQKKKILGLFGGSDAQVKAFIEVAEKKKKPITKNNQKQKSNNQKPVKKAEAKPNKETKPEVKEKPAETNKETPKKENSYGEPVDRSKIAVDTPVGKAVAYIETVLKAVGCENTDIKVASRDGGSLILLNGENLNIVIGRRGETLDSLQYLASLVANNGGGHYKISINIGDYRERREETLTELANKIAAQVLKTGKNRTLEPMNPYERRIIHTAVQGIEGVLSGSYGDGNNRRVVIYPEGGYIRAPRGNDRRRRGQGSRPQQTSKTVAPAENREPKRDSDMPLYGKIN